MPYVLVPQNEKQPLPYYIGPLPAVVRINPVVKHIFLPIFHPD